MFFTSLIVIYSLGYFITDSFNINFFIIALIATLLEQFSLVGIDNLIVPIATAISFNILINAR